MKWYLLKDRRQLGPFTTEEIVEGLKSDKFDLKDYLLPESAVKDQSSFAYVLVSSVVGPEIVFDIEKRKQKNTNIEKTNVDSDRDFKNQNKAEHEARLKELRAQFEKDLESSQLAQSRLSPDRVPATTGNIDGYSTSSFFSHKVRVESSSSKLWVSLSLVLFLVAGFISYQMGFFENQKSQVSVKNTDSMSQKVLTRPSRFPASVPSMNRSSASYPSLPRPPSLQRLNSFRNRIPSSQIQLPTPTTRNVEEAPSVVHTEEVGVDSAESVGQRNPAMMKKLLQLKKGPRKNSETFGDESGESTDDPEAAQESEPENDDENNAE